MDIQGKIIWQSEPRSGVSKRSGSNWKSQDFVIETHEQYPKKCIFTVFGEDRLNKFNIQVGGEYTVSVDIDAHEYNGRWFNDIRAWNVVPGTAPAAASAAPAPTPAGAPQAPVAGPLPADDKTDDLPF